MHLNSWCLINVIIDGGHDEIRFQERQSFTRLRETSFKLKTAPYHSYFPRIFNKCIINCVKKFRDLGLSNESR